MATLILNCDGTANSFENNANIRITYTAGGGSVTVTEIEGMRTDGYSSYEDVSQTIQITVGGVAKTVSVGRVRFMSGSSYSSWNVTDTTWTELSGKVSIKVGGLTHWSGAAYYNKTFTSTSDAIDAGSTIRVITYDANGGTGAPSQQEKKDDVSLTLSSTKPTRTGYTFKGWCMSPEGVGTMYNAGGTFTQNASLTLFAIWDFVPMVQAKSNSSWVSGDLQYKSGSSWLPASAIKLKTNGDF